MTIGKLRERHDLVSAPPLHPSSNFWEWEWELEIHPHSHPSSNFWEWEWELDIHPHSLPPPTLRDGMCYDVVACVACVALRRVLDSLMNFIKRSRTFIKFWTEGGRFK